MRRILQYTQARKLMGAIYFGLALFATATFLMAPYLSPGAQQDEIVVDLAVTPDVLAHHHAPQSHDGYKSKAHCGATGCIAVNDLKIWKISHRLFVRFHLEDAAVRGVNAEHEPPPPKVG